MAVLLDKTIHIDASPERVFEYLSPPRVPLWDKSVLRFSPRGAGPPHEGAVLDRVAHSLGHRFEAVVETVAFESGRLFAWRQVQGDYEENEGAYLLEPDGEGTRLHLVADLELPFVLPRLATEAEVRASLSRDADEALFNLKALAEQPR